MEGVSSKFMEMNCSGLIPDSTLLDIYGNQEGDIFMKSLFDEFIDDFTDIPLYLRGDSVFASPDLYEVLEEKNCQYAIRAECFSKSKSLMDR